MSSEQHPQVSKMSDSVLSKSIPVQRTDLSTFDDAFSFMKEKFTAEMKKKDQEMTKFSTDLMLLYGQAGSATAAWETIIHSPLVQGEGEDKTLKLQFDVSQFDPNEIKVQIIKDLLKISATHEEKSGNSSIFREFKREFLLPKGINMEGVVSSLARDGVLTVQTPLPPMTGNKEKETKESPQKAKLPMNPQIVQNTLSIKIPQSPQTPQSPQIPQSAQSHQSPKKAGSKASKK